MKPGERKQGPASLLVSVSKIVRPELRPGLREISLVHCEPEHRRNGWANALLQQVTLEADSGNIALILTVRPYDNEATDPNADRLEQWYAAHGFVRFQDAPLMMMRSPMRTQQARQAMQ